MPPTRPFGGLKISDGDAAGQEWLDEARKRLDYDAEFAYRVHGVRQAMHAAFINAPGEAHIAVAVLLEEKIRRANGLR